MSDLAREHVVALAIGGGGADILADPSPEFIAKQHEALAALDDARLAQTTAVLARLSLDDAMASIMAEGDGLLAEVPDKMRMQALRDPWMNLWARSCLDNRRTARREIWGYSSFAAATALRAGVAFENFTLPVDASRAIMLPGIGRAMPRLASHFVTVDGKLLNGGTPTILNSDPRYPFPIHFLAHVHVDGRKTPIVLDDLTPMRSHDLHESTTPRNTLSDGETDSWDELIRHAWEYLEMAHPAYADLLRNQPMKIVPISGAGEVDANLRSPGLGILPLPFQTDERRFAATMVESFQLGVLKTLHNLTTHGLHKSPQGQRTFYEPSEKLASSFGDLLGNAYTLPSRLAFLRQAIRRGYDFMVEDTSEGRANFGVNSLNTRRGETSHGFIFPGQELPFIREEWATSLRERQIFPSGLLTDEGQLIFGGLRGVADRIVQTYDDLQRPLPTQRRITEELSTKQYDLVKVTGLDHYISWRIRNVVLDSTEINALAKKFIGGAERPTEPLTTHFATYATGEIVEVSTAEGRLRDFFAQPRHDVYAHYLHPEVAPRQATLKPEFVPDHVESWANYALAAWRMEASAQRALLSYPEVVCVVYDSIARQGHDNVDPLEVAAWLHDLPDPPPFSNEKNPHEHV